MTAKSIVCVFLTINLCFIHALYAQSDTITSENNASREEIFRPDKFNTCWGVGTDYGGIGTKLLVYPYKYTGIFVGVGYTPAGMGYNAGIKLRYIKDTLTCFLQPFLTMMYGTNFMVLVENQPSLNETFRSFTPGAGIDIRPKFMDPVSLSFSILYSHKSKKALDYKNKIISNYNVIFYNERLIVISMGINFRIK
ncbi:MAG: hypothetical protein ACP5DZ_07245 [Bacteroidales bacterium]